VASARAILGVTITFVGHPEEQCVRPNRHTAERSGDGSVVHEELMFHHLELFVAAYSQVWGTDSDNRTVRDVGEPAQPKRNGFNRR